MRRLVAVLACVGLICSAHAQTVGQIITPTPISLALTIGQWLMKDQKKLYYIEVESRAPTFQQARDEGFRLAVEHAVGSLILSETDVRSGRLERDEIITYASGYVDRFEIINRMDTGDGTILQLKVWVAHSAIANRLLNTSKTAGQIDGEQSATQINTITRSRQQGDRVLETVLADYPKRAFDVDLDSTKVVYDANRSGQLYISFVLRWNRKYLDSLVESLQAVNQKPGCDSMFKRCMAVTWVQVNMPGFSSNRLFGFDDSVPWTIFQRETVLSRPSVLVKIKDFDGNVQYTQCFVTKELDHNQWNSWYYVGLGPGEITINGDRAKRLDTYINLNSLRVERIKTVELSVVRANECN